VQGDHLSTFIHAVRSPHGVLPQARIADSEFEKRSQLSSARTTKRFPSPRCASTIQIVRPQEFTVENAAPTPTVFLEILSDDFPVLHAGECSLFVFTMQ
jgi:hypothetical protein